MEYKNTKTGVVINVNSKISGGDWVAVTDEKTVPVTATAELVQDVPAPVETVEEPGENTAEVDGVTKKEIMQELDAMGIEYNARSSKQELYDLMTKGA